MFVKMKKVKIFGLWTEHKDETTRFFFWVSSKDLKEKVDLFCTDSYKRLSNIKLEQWEVQPKNLQRMAVSLCGRMGNCKLPFAPISFSILDETDTFFKVKVHYTDILKEPKLNVANIQVSRPFGNNDQTLDIEIKTPCSMPNGKVRHAIVSNIASFSTNVSTEHWTIDASKSLIVINKSPYGFFSTARHMSISPSVFVLKQGGAPFGWTPAALQYYIGNQFSPSERKSMKEKDIRPGSYKMPLLTEVKHKIGHLLQVEDQLIYLMMKEPGVGVVGLVIEHGILLDCQKGSPVMDMSVCFLSGDISLPMANAVMHLNSTPDRMRSIEMWKEEYRLFQNLCNYFRATMAPSLRKEHSSLKALVPSKSMRSHFVRVLMRPLFISATTHEDIMGGSLADKLLQSLVFL